MKKFNKLKLNEKLFLIAILIEYFNDGIKYSYNGKIKIFEPKTINFDNAYEVSRVLYIMSNFIINKKSYDVTPKLYTLNINENIETCVQYFKESDFLAKLDILIYVCKFLSTNRELKKINFIDEIKNNYRFIDLSNDILKYKLKIEKYINI